MNRTKSVFGIFNLAISGLVLLWLLNSPVLTRSAQRLVISGPATCQQGQACNYTASGGAQPYTFTLVSGSVGSISPAGLYTAPAHVVPKHVINGCQGMPNNSILNTRIDALPVNPNSAVWLSNTTAGNIYYTGAQRIHGSTVLSTDNSTRMGFYYTPQANGPFIFMPFPNTLAESGTDVPGGLVGAPGRDEHVLTTYRDNCKQQEIYQLYQNNIYSLNPGGNSQAGVIYSLTNFVHPGYGVDAAASLLSPLTVHLDEMLSAAAGNLDAVQHAVRLMEDAASIDASIGIWPAQNPGGNAGCRGGTVPHTACPPYGARFRLKASYVWPGFDGVCATPACQNVVKALLRSQQRYGIILSDVGSNGEVDYDGGQITSADIGNAFKEIFPRLRFNKDNFEAVDESMLNTRQGGGPPDQKWLEAKLNNGIMKPDDAVVIKVTDGAGNAAYHSVALQGVAIGVPSPIEVVMAGASQIQFTPWVTGSSNPAYSCSLSPNRGANGIITSGCLYTPPTTSAVTTRTDTTVTITAAADTTVTKTFHITILPVAADGNLYISLGKAAYSDTYTDKNGIVWWSDLAPGRALGLFPDANSGAGGGNWTGANSAEAPGIYTQGAMGTSVNDLHFNIWVPNGAVTGTVYMANFAAAANIQGFSFDCNGNRVIDVSDTFTYTGSRGPYTAAALTCSPHVANGKLHMVLRWQGINLQKDPCCNAPVYHTSSLGVWASGLMVSPGSRPPRLPQPPRP